MTLKISKILAFLQANKAADATTQPCETPLTKLEKLGEQLLDSVIVGGIAWISQVVVTNGDLSPVGFLIGFGLTFLIKLKEYRKID